MGFTDLSTRLLIPSGQSGHIPPVLAGPMLRKVTPQSVTVWLALRSSGKVTLAISTASGLWQSRNFLVTPYAARTLSRNGMRDLRSWPFLLPGSVSSCRIYPFHTRVIRVVWRRRTAPLSEFSGPFFLGYPPLLLLPLERNPRISMV
jgi:hypothetical protein